MTDIITTAPQQVLKVNVAPEGGETKVTLNCLNQETIYLMILHSGRPFLFYDCLHLAVVSLCGPGTEPDDRKQNHSLWFCFLSSAVALSLCPWIVLQI